MKKALLIGVAFATLLLSACTDKLDFIPQTSNLEQKRGDSVDPDEEFADVPFFSNGQQLQDAIENGTIATHSSRNSRVRTIAEKRASIESRMILTETPDHYEISGVTDDEIHFLEKVDSLIVDPVLEKVVSSNFMIRVADRIYKITNKGTFSFNAKNVTKQSIDRYVNEFQETIGISDGDDVYYVPMPGELSAVPFVPNNNNGTSEISPIDRIMYDDSMLFDLSTYKWQKLDPSNWSTLFGLFGTNITKHKNFDRKHRMFFKLFDVNYIFYHSAGLKVKFQVKRAFGIWFNTKKGVERIAVGLEKLYATIRSNVEFATFPFPHLSDFTSSIEGQLAKVIYSGLAKCDFLKDLTNPMYSFHTKEVLSKKAAGFLLQDAVSFLNEEYDQQYTLRDPLGLFYNPRNSKADICLSGHKEFDEKAYVIHFMQSAGFTFLYSPGNGASVSGFLPYEIDILSESSLYGALKYNGEWKGIRFECK